MSRSNRRSLYPSRIAVWFCLAGIVAILGLCMFMGLGLVHLHATWYFALPVAIGLLVLGAVLFSMEALAARCDGDRIVRPAPESSTLTFTPAPLAPFGRPRIRRVK